MEPTTELIARFPVFVVDNTFVVLTVGRAAAEFGDTTRVLAESGQPLFGGYVHGVDTAPADEFEPDVLAIFGATSVGQLVAHLSRAYGTQLPENSLLTIYTIGADPVEAL